MGCETLFHAAVNVLPGNKTVSYVCIDVIFLYSTKLALAQCEQFSRCDAPKEAILMEFGCVDMYIFRMLSVILAGTASTE